MRFFFSAARQADVRPAGASSDSTRRLAAAVLIAATLLAPAAAQAEGWPELKPEARQASTTGSSSPFSAFGVTLIRFYQQVISPLDGDTCGFRPVCSAYAREAVREHGFLVGSLMAADRLERCNPYNHMAHYPVDPDGYLHDDVDENALFR